MNNKLIVLALGVAALSSCSTAYKMGQTPDDVYFSPAKEQNTYAAAKDQQNRYSPSDRYGNANGYDDFDAYRNDRFLRMSIGNPLRLSAFDNYYGYDGYSNWKYNNYAYNWNSPWNSYYYWNNYFNPYSTFNFYTPYYGYSYGYPGYGNTIGGGGSKLPVSGVNSRPNGFNARAYANRNFSNSNLYLDRNTSNSRPANTNAGGRYYNNSNSSNSGTMRRAFSNQGNEYYNNSNNSNNSGSRYNNSYTSPRTESYTPSRSMGSEAPVRSYTPATSSGSSSSGSSGGGGGVSRPSRGGGN
jgi:hypothetical protein